MSNYDPDEATAREDLCRFLSACYYEPAPEFAQENLFDSMRVAASRLDPELAEQARRLGQAFDAEDLQTLLVDYTRLFLGPLEMLARPYESTWLAAGAPTDEHPAPTVLALYGEFGFEVDAEVMESPDHVAVELEFLYLLTFTKNRATQAGHDDKLAATEQLLQRFMDQHLGVWLGPFCAAVSAGAQTAFYRELAAFTNRFVRMVPVTAVVH
jgi:TorA maturation chaperone TorD